MKKLQVENLNFVEIGGLGEMIYRAVQFPEYIPDYSDDGEMLKPVFTGLHAPDAPEGGTDYSLTGQDLLVSLCNLYKELNNNESTVSITNAVWEWCKNNIHPYNIDSLYEMLNDEKYAHITYMDLIRDEASFNVNQFIKDLCSLGTVFELYFALRKVKYYGETDFARNLYYEGRLCKSLSYLERYRHYVKDEEYKACLLENYNDHLSQVIDMFPYFRMRLKLDKKTGKVMYGTAIQSVFDICWYAFSRMAADDAQPADDDQNYSESYGSILSCLACGKYFARHSSRQLYCNSYECQAARNRKNRRASYARKRAAGKIENME
jgi:hypothetical protein